MHQSEELEFSAMRQAYRRTGGLAIADDVAQRLSDRMSQPVSVVARWIVSRSVLNIQWGSQRLVPLFQFDVHGLSPRPSVAAVIRELADVFDDWELALWFVQPNPMLRGASPMDVIALDATAVLAAARAQRFVARG